MTKKFYPNPCGEFYNPKTNKIFVPNEEPIAHSKFVPNPIEWEEWGEPTYMKLFIGLTAGRDTSYHRKGQKISDKVLREAIRGVRTGQVGVKYGSSFISQIGHWYDKDTKEFTEENSMQVVIFSADTESWQTFVSNIKYLADIILDGLSQKEIIWEASNKGNITTGVAKWKD